MQIEGDPGFRVVFCSFLPQIMAAAGTSFFVESGGKYCRRMALFSGHNVGIKRNQAILGDLANGTRVVREMDGLIMRTPVWREPDLEKGRVLVLSRSCDHHQVARFFVGRWVNRVQLKVVICDEA